MGNLLQRFHKRVDHLWHEGSYQRFAKLGGFLTVALVLIAGTNLIFGSRGDTRAISNQLSKGREFQNEANLPFEFQFVGQGRITGGSDDKWIIGDVAIQINERSQLKSELHPGDFVSLSGRILQNEEWLADRIELTREGEPFFTFNGPLEWVRGTIWGIGGHSLLTDVQTKIGSNLMLNDLLLATFTVLDTGGWMALEIKAFEQFPLEPIPIATATPTLIPEPTILPTETGVSSPSSISQPAWGEEQERRERPPKPKKNHPSNKGKGKGNK